MPGIIYITLCTERAPFGCGTGAIGVAGPGLISAIGCLGTSGTTMINQYHQLGKMESLTSDSLRASSPGCSGGGAKRACLR